MCATAPEYSLYNSPILIMLTEENDKLVPQTYFWLAMNKIRKSHRSSGFISYDLIFLNFFYTVQRSTI